MIPTSFPWEFPSTDRALCSTGLAFVLLVELSVATSESIDPGVGRPDLSMWCVQQHPLDLPHVSIRQPPVVPAHHAEIDDRIARHTSSEVHVGIDIAERQRSWSREERFTAVEAGVAGTRDRTPAPAMLVDEQDVIEVIDGFEAQNERREPMLFQNHRSRERRLQTVCRVVSHDAAEASQGRARRRRLGVVRQPIQEALDRERRA